jgi:hypothetical protein
VGNAEKPSRRGTGEWGDGTKRLYNYYCSHTGKVVGWSETGIVGVDTEAKKQFPDLRLGEENWNRGRSAV